MVWISIMLCAAFFFALNHILKKKILEDADVLDMMILLSTMAMLFMLPTIPFVDFSISHRNLMLIIANTILAFAGSYCLNVAYKNCEISTVSPLLNLNPILVILLSYFFLGEVLNSIQWIGIFLILIGGYIITLKNIRGFLHPFTSMPIKYFLIMLMTLIFWGFCPVLNRLVLLELDAVSYMFFFISFVFCINFSVLIITSRYKRILALAKAKWFLLFITALVWVISDMLHLVAIAIPAAVVSLIVPVKRTSNLFTVILGGNLFKERNLVMKTGACIIMLAGLFIISLYA